jgi:hypothetical protein
MRALTNEQREAVKAYSEHFGPGWKDRLRSDWMRHGSAFEDYHVLAGLRNSHGPRWLDGYRG